MGQLIELVFEAQSAPSATALVEEILSASCGPLHWVMDGEERTVDDISQLVSQLHSCATVRIPEAALPEIGVVPNVGVRVLRVGEVFDIELNVDLDDVHEPRALASGLHEFANEVANRHGVKNYFCGLEPAGDEDTRLFTGTNMGPFRFPGGS